MTPIISTLQSTLESLADRSGQLGDQSKREISDFISALAPDIDVATELALTGEATHLRTVDLIYDAVLTRATDVGAGFVFQEKAAVAAAVIGTIRGFVAAGLNLLAPGAGTVLETLTRQV